MVPEPLASRPLAVSRPRARRRWRRAVLIAAATATILLLPYILAYRAAPDHLAFSGLIMNPEDSQTYFAKMLQGYDGAWLYRIPFTPEPHAPAFLGGVYLALGHLARLAGLSLEVIWHAARFFSGLVLFLTTYWFIAAYVREEGRRLLAYLLALFGSGLGWLLFLLNQPYWLGAFPVDFKMPEAHLFFTAFTFPHVALGTALMLISVRHFDRLLQPQNHARTGRVIFTAALGNILLLIAYPFLLYILLLVVILVWAWRASRQRTLLPRQAIRIAISFLPAAPLAIYYAYVLLTNPVFAAWNAQAGTPSFPWPHYLIAFGPLLLLALLAPLENRKVASANSNQESGREFLWIWIVAAALLLYAPFGPQRRFVQGIHVPLSILAAAGLLGVVWPALRNSAPLRRLLQHPRYTEQGMRRLFLIFALAFLSLSNIYIFASVSATATFQHPFPLFRPQNEMDAVRWLRARAEPDEVVLGAYQTGNLIAARAGNAVVLGHWAETMAYDAKVAAVARFFDAGTDDAWRRDLLDRFAVAYVWHGPQERALGAFDPQSAPYLQVAAQFPAAKTADNITLYTVNLP